MRRLLGLATFFALPALTVIASSSTVHAEYTPSPPGQGDVSMALSACKNMLRRGSSPGLIQPGDFWEWTTRLIEAKRKDPDAVTKFASKTNHLGDNPKELMPKCDKLVADYLKGVDAEKQPALSRNCENNVASDFRTIEREASQLKAGTGSITLMRQSVERSRQTLYVFTGRKMLGYTTCAPNDQHKKAFAPLAQKFKDHEAIVVAAEIAAGVKYVGSKDEGVTLDFVDLKTGQPVRAPMSGTPVDFSYP